MAQPTLNILVITPNLAAWEADVNTNFATLASAFEDNPLIVKFYTTKASLPAAGSNNETLAIVTADASAFNNGLYRSNGTTWLQQLTLDQEGDGQALVSHDGEVVAKLRRRANTVNNQTMIDLAALDSGSAEKVYGRIGAEIRVNTAAAEEGDMVIEAMDGSGALVEALRIHGLEQHARSAGSNGVGSMNLAAANALTDKANGDELWISDGVKVTEIPTGGTGVRAYYDVSAAAWLRHSDDTAVVV